MITSVFKKSTPLNYSLVVILILVFFFMFQIRETTWINSYFTIFQKISLLCFIFASFFMVNFIVKKNGLSKDNGYAIFFYLLFLLFFPTVFNNPNVVYANFFILLALRRLISLQSLKASKEKIFDASFWIFVASLFQFWSVLFLILVFISIIFHVSRDYRNWVLPFIALLAVSIIFFMISLMFNIDAAKFFQERAVIDFRIDYFKDNYENGALSIYAAVVVFFVFSMLTTLSNRPQIVHTSYKKVVACFFIAVLVYIISPDKSNDLLLFSIAPLAMMAASHVEYMQQKLNNEIVFYVLILCSLFTFFSQL
ncbi:DUF6427 family protein [Flavobacterium johnsoniae]|jgi:hypothetical protein|uniref:Beta-carotene 15,15'-monooxygenase n=1 Tax=Flavobacterium johnsoniae (strain ATCC 17061 / DSM 2064 / JCM 8514 / BCRC 14874 / CCUG 350202 / NBRC 14942 / NCIMB 11054 / UW101) TaxID=376686 RepID=A5FL51_FLAJ1|nr:DUF6427 family protein [Flavobacterium johnsoniae]ABQ04076.1 hypothetical protein Fjoh_1043 [Flavobacterium johnsoniae UW101]OXG02688.1 hypothetical protein B0A63_03265 [Flavobacterium johnsoniae UW101]WQG79053.1 DUF6427 family protein [Flavobacterium johnsoniae UW101]SHK11661.1 hypothetical protein SAMN05444146_0457 [Flavobacterium johnsoniae]